MDLRLSLSSSRPRPPRVRVLDDGTEEVTERPVRSFFAWFQNTVVPARKDIEEIGEAIRREVWAFPQIGYAYKDDWIHRKIPLILSEDSVYWSSDDDDDDGDGAVNGLPIGVARNGPEDDAEVDVEL